VLGPLDIEISSQPERTVVALAGELDMSTAPELEEAIRSCAEAADELILDLSGLTFMDSSGLRAILGGERFCSEHRCKCLVAEEVPRQVKDLFEIAGVLDHFTTQDRRDGRFPTSRAADAARQRRSHAL
jgi:anti-sigma B factor antagonist